MQAALEHFEKFIHQKYLPQIEDNHLKLSAVLVTHNHSSHTNGIKTLKKIYTPKIYAADWEVAGEDTTVISGDGTTKLAKMIVRYMSVPGHTSDSVVYQIGNILFTGDILSAGEIGSTNSSYSEYILKSNIEKKIFSQQDNIILMPGHGPPTTLGAVKAFTADFKKMIQSPSAMFPHTIPYLSYTKSFRAFAASSKPRPSVFLT